MPLFLAVALAYAAGLLAPPAAAQDTIGEPFATGDQLLFFYDTRDPRVTFINLSNPADEDVTLDVAAPAAGVRETVVLGPRANRVVDPTALAPGGRGILVVTPVLGADDPRAIVPPAPLLGSFTLANLALGSAFGGNALGRRAVTGGAFAASGSIVDGAAVRYQRFAPAQLAIPVYFDPRTVGPPELDGNRLLLAAFSDRYEGGRYVFEPRSGTVTARFYNRDGIEVAVTTAPLAGSLLDVDLVTLADTPLDTSGKVFLSFLPGEPVATSFIGLFSQSLDTFGAGGVLPEVGLSNGS